MAQEQAKSESAAAGAEEKAKNPLEAMTRLREEKSAEGPLERVVFRHVTLVPGWGGMQERHRPGHTATSLSFVEVTGQQGSSVARRRRATGKISGGRGRGYAIGATSSSVHDRSSASFCAP